MRLLHTKTLELSEFLGSNIPPYAILSHTWGAEEVSFDDMNGDRGTTLTKAGYRKIRQCCDKALLDGFDYLWVDTCCIDKRSSAELSEAWMEIGTKEALSNRIAEISGIHAQILASPFDLSLATIAQKMSWAAGRKTTRDEDIAYCLMGLFGVNMPMLYGEGAKAFQRLQLEIIKTTHDHSIFAWRRRRDSEHSEPSGFLASSPDGFSDSGTICLSISRRLEWQPYSWTNLGIRIRLDAVYGEHNSHYGNSFSRRIRSDEFHEAEYTENGAPADQFGEPIYPFPKGYVEQSWFYFNIDP
ncbi:HET-domain-containing protein [Zopfia rhizophila CBS 207.26]|uniref:HET-domain-containing protein n=1 Tax=Zopfia rhizophila CBS 207.26 TaxID=1314779 RepID=A0A6A6EX66_9PEZI|nr:HET-domain-containing protein [Zopfia rhizophila CBS 207.26]